MQTLRSPLRKHWELIDEEDEEEKDATEAKAVALRDAFEIIAGMRIGRSIDIRRVDGQVRDPVMNEDDTEPSDDAIDTGFRFRDFQKGATLLSRIQTHAFCRRGSCVGVLVGLVVAHQGSRYSQTSRDSDTSI